MLALYADVFAIFHLDLGGLFSFQPLLFRLVTALLPLFFGLLFIFFLAYLQSLVKTGDLVLF